MFDPRDEAMRIVTIEREYGCGAPAIADRLAKRLGWKVWDQALTEEIAKIAKVEPTAARRCDERIDPLLYRLAKTFWRGSHERSMALADSGVFDTDCMMDLMQQVMENAAREGNCVIVGRGAAYFMRERRDAFNVFLFADRDEKISRLMRGGKTESQAIDDVETVDKERAAFVKRYFGKDWPNFYRYHAMINTAMGDDNVVELILSGMRLLEKPVPVAVARS
jgi:cytidylate kinase